jgi:XTP/dITP diphosphohydrolase
MPGPARIHLATGNRHKLGEFQELARAAALALEFALVERMPQVEEDTGTFEGNARKKAMAVQAVLPPGSWVLADDSGLCVDALGGAPGVESAYYAGAAGDSAANLRKLVEAMRGVPTGRRGAAFFCVLVLRGPAGREHLFSGRCPGALRDDPAGGGGFGYDPLFVPEGQTLTFAELPAAEKNLLSHRGLAWRQLVSWWESTR